jgi:hypothetical protein|tara:strand:+ start:2645 stop:2854 length:210 start_codon:yes stop_codon:yes gene_type:complete
MVKPDEEQTRKDALKLYLEGTYVPEVVASNGSANGYVETKAEIPSGMRNDRERPKKRRIGLPGKPQSGY